MIDIHSHIIFGVDDGPKTLEESLELIKESYDQGVRTIIATSHRRKGMFETPEEKIYSNYELLKNKTKEIFGDFELYYGAEIYCTFESLKKIENDELPTIENTKYVLLEFSSTSRYNDIDKAVSQMVNAGKIPILAHIERYNELENNGKGVESLINRGAYIQINAASVLKPKLFGDSLKIYKKRAKYFLENDLVHFIASDVHNTTTRKTYMRDAYNIVEKKYGSKRAEKLFKLNQQEMLNNNRI